MRHRQRGTERQRNVGIVSRSIRKSSEFVVIVVYAKCWYQKMPWCHWTNWWAAHCPTMTLFRKSVVLLHAFTSITYSTKVEVIIFVENWFLFYLQLIRIIEFFVGSSKVAAKNNVSEKALRDIIIQKMVQTPKSILKGNVAGGGKSSKKFINYYNKYWC